MNKNKDFPTRDEDIQRKSNDLSGYGSLEVYMQRKHGDKHPYYRDRKTKLNKDK